MWKPWNPTKKDITQGFKQKEHDFASKEIGYKMHSMEKWLQKYIFSELYKPFFGEFKNILTKWVQ